MIEPINISNIKNISKDTLKEFVMDFIKVNAYIKSSTISRDLARIIYGVDKKHPMYYTVRDILTAKIKVILRNLALDGVIEVYSRRSHIVMYKNPNKFIYESM